MRIFLAGAAGAIGRRLVPLLLQAGHKITGTTRTAEKAHALERAGVVPAVLDVFDAGTVTAAMRAAKPEVLTDLPREFDEALIAASYAKNARIRTEGTRNLIATAQAAGARRFIVQSIAFGYAPGGDPHHETDPLNLADPARGVSIKGTVDMERQVLAASGLEGVILRYGRMTTASSRSPKRAPNSALTRAFACSETRRWLAAFFTKPRRCYGQGVTLD